LMSCLMKQLNQSFANAGKSTCNKDSYHEISLSKPFT
jgi:hypothetical protein